MRRTGTADLPLHGGRAPAWLFRRMTRLAAALTEALVLYARRTPAEIEAWGRLPGLDPEPLVYASRLTAKVDSAAVQDGYTLYHHVFFATTAGRWAVVQQGMDDPSGTARRYHWLGEGVADFVCEPHAAVCGEPREGVLNFVAAESGVARGAAAAVAREDPARLLAELDRARRLELPRRHALLASDVATPHVRKILLRTYEAQPADFERLLGLPGVGARTLRALNLLADLLCGAPAATRDPAAFAFAHGGKDGTPYPVDRETYDRTIDVLADAVSRCRAGRSERLDALRRLSAFQPAPGAGAHGGRGLAPAAT